MAVKLGRLTLFAVSFEVMEEKRLFVFAGLAKAPAEDRRLAQGDFNTGCRYWDEGRIALSLVEDFEKLLGCALD